MFASIFITVKSIKQQVRENKGFSVAQLFRNKLFFTIMVSLLSTWVMWLVVSILFLDPWHMATSVGPPSLSRPQFSARWLLFSLC
jgi:chitin synthase